MSNIFSNKIKVIGTGCMCFPVDQKTLEPTSVSCYDPQAYTLPEKDAIETITLNEYLIRYNNLKKETA